MLRFVCRGLVVSRRGVARSLHVSSTADSDGDRINGGISILNGGGCAHTFSLLLLRAQGGVRGDE